MTKKAIHSDRMKFNKKGKIRMNYESNSKIDNPFNKVIDRHFGSFKCNILGNYKNVFNSLNINSIKPLGNQGAVKRKLLRTKKFTAIFYCSKNKGSVELKIPRALNSSKTAIQALQASYYEAAIQAKAHLEKYYCFALDIPVQNRVAKYGVEDLTAKAVNLEVQGKKRKMDASNRHINGKFVRNIPHIDNFGAVACRADSRLSSAEHDLISDEIACRQGLKDKKSLDFRVGKAKARLQAPEVLGSIENALFALVDAQKEGAENIKHFGVNMKAHVKAIKKLAAAADRIAPKKKKMPTSFKKSATVRGCR